MEENKENSTKLMAAGIIAALGASLCCITPVLAFVAGIGGAASAFSWLDPFRPYLIGLTVLILGYAWYQKLKPKREDLNCACEDKKDEVSFMQSRKFLGVVTALVVLLMAFPYYSGAFFPDKPVKEAMVVKYSALHQAKLSIKGMTCTGCESSVNHALKSKEGVVEAKANYEEGMASVTYDPAAVTVEDLKAVIEEDVGYQVIDIQKVTDKVQ